MVTIAMSRASSPIPAAGQLRRGGDVLAEPLHAVVMQQNRGARH
jgi:hypothetical protein